MQELLQQLVIAVSLGATYALIALGYTMVYGVLRLINFAHGEVYMMGAVAGFHLAGWTAGRHDPPAVKLVIVFGGAMAACAALGFAIERFAYRPLRSRPRLVALITAIGVSLLLQSVAQHPQLGIFGPTPRTFGPLIASRPVVSFHVGASGTPVTISNIDLLSGGLAVGLMAALRWIVLRTRAGLALRAVSYRTDTASLMGINTNRTISLTFVIGSALAAVAGVMDGIRYNVHPLMGVAPGLKAFVAAVLGGIGSIPGAVAGAMILALAETMAKFWLPKGYTEYADGVAFLALILILLFRPSGLLGRRAVEKV